MMKWRDKNMELYKSIINMKGEEWLVIREFEFGNKEYVYAIKSLNAKIEKIEDLDKYKDQIEIKFFEKSENGKYETIISPTYEEILYYACYQDMLKESEKENKKLKRDFKF